MLPMQERTLAHDEYNVLDALLQHNYLPAQKGMGEELPPLLTSQSFTLPAVEALLDISLRRNGYDSMKYATTRPNQSARSLSIPHPLPYAHSVFQMASYWSELEHITKNKRSHIKPKLDTSDGGRILCMNYHEQPLEQLERQLDASLGKSFCARTDIQKCFSNMPVNLFSKIESETELLRIDGSKPNYRNRWFYKLERSLASSNCNRTTGLAVGPAGSNIIAEYLLHHIDRVLEQKGFQFDRYIDDYVCYCDSYEEAESFLALLRGRLQGYGLTLNAGKTSITTLPQPLSPDWIIDLQAAFPAMKYDEHTFSLAEALRYLDYALRLQKQQPNQSILKFASKSILDRINGFEGGKVYLYILNLSREYPSLLPLLRSLKYFTTEFMEESVVHELLKVIVRDNAKARRSDGVVWGLYYLLRLNAELDDGLVEVIHQTKDPLSLLCLQAHHIGTGETLSLLMSLSDEGDLWAIDRYWMLFYQFYLEGIIPNPYPQDNSFEILRFYDVNFVGKSGLRTDVE